MHTCTAHLQQRQVFTPPRGLRMTFAFLFFFFAPLLVRPGPIVSLLLPPIASSFPLAPKAFPLAPRLQPAGTKTASRWLYLYACAELLVSLTLSPSLSRCWHEQLHRDVPELELSRAARRTLGFDSARNRAVLFFTLGSAERPKKFPEIRKFDQKFIPIFPCCSEQLGEEQQQSGEGGAERETHTHEREREREREREEREGGRERGGGREGGERRAKRKARYVAT